MGDYGLKIKEWENPTVLEWLDTIFSDSSIGYIKHTFKENNITGLDLLEITEQELKEDLCITVFSHRKSLVRSIQRIKGKFKF